MPGLKILTHRSSSAWPMTGLGWYGLGRAVETCRLTGLFSCACHGTTNKGLGRAVETCRLIGLFQSSSFPALPSPLSRSPDKTPPMAQSSGSDQHQAPFFPWDLPLTLQESILSLLLVSTLTLCLSVSRSWQSTIRSPTFISSLRCRSHILPDDLYLILFTDDGSPAAAYHPSRDCWLSFRLPPSLSTPHASVGGLVMAEAKHGHLVIFDLFSGAALNLRHGAHPLALPPRSYRRIPLVGLGPAWHGLSSAWPMVQNGPRTVLS